jgi:hypothetical protein
MKLGVIIPSNNFEEFETHVLVSIPHLLEGLEAHEIRLLVCSQNWPVASEVKRVVEGYSYDLQLMETKAEQESPPRMCYLRQRAAALWPQAQVYMLADSNMRWAPGRTDTEVQYPVSSGTRYAEVLDYFIKQPLCGVVQCHTTHPARARMIEPVNNGLITTNKGLFIRNMFTGQVWPEASMAFKASLEETVAGYRVLEQGFFIARQYQNPTYHTIHKIDSDSHLHSRQLIYENAGKWVRERYEDPTWEHESERLPRALFPVTQIARRMSGLL